jgi:hypothetical protein
VNGDDLFYELRALAALELELDHLVAEKVGEARRAGLPWDAIAQAAGVSRPSAWRRWKTVVDDPRPTRPLRRDAGQLLLTGEATHAAQRLTAHLAQRLTSRQDSHPWSSAVRVALDRLSLRYDVVQRDAREIEYRLRTVRLQITSLEPSAAGLGGLSAVTLPSPELSLSGQGQPRTAHLTSDGQMPISGEALVETVITFIRETVTAEGNTSATAPGKRGQAE